VRSRGAIPGFSDQRERMLHKLWQFARLPYG
jgi:hypothetical protein